MDAIDSDVNSTDFREAIEEVSEIRSLSTKQKSHIAITL